MNDYLDFILRRIDSRHFADLWSFYRDYYHSDTACIAFIADALKKELEGSFEKNLPGSDGKEINDEVLVPRRMLNAVMRFTAAARDMEMIRRGKDIFKVVYIITCIETLQILSSKKDLKKWEMIVSFFGENISEEDSLTIQKKFQFAPADDTVKDTAIARSITIREFAGILSEYRNCAVHEGDYWDFCFNNNNDGYPLQLLLDIDLEKFSRSSSKKGSEKKSHVFQTELSYKEFERIFVRTSLSFISKYIKSHPKEV